MAGNRCPECDGAGVRGVPLAGTTGAAVRPCPRCGGSGRVADPPPEDAPPGYRGPLILLGAGLAITGVAIGLSFPLRNKPAFVWVMAALVVGLVMAVVGANNSFEWLMNRFGHLHIPSWAGIAILVALLAAVLIAVILQ